MSDVARNIRQALGSGDAHTHPSAGGAYLWGGPGCGKTFCMDLAYACLPGADGKSKRREHFHSFMMATHNALHRLGQAGRDADTVALYAADVAKVRCCESEPVFHAPCCSS